MADGYFSDQDFAAWLASLPGKTEAQKLNYLQDILGTVGVDLFGAKQESYVPASRPANPIEAVWGNDPGMSVVMDFIQFDNMSPKAAVDEARRQGLIPKYDEYSKGEVNYMDLASQFAGEQAKLSDWDKQQMVEAAKYEAGRKPGLNDLFQTPYEQMGSPSVDDLMANYAQDRQRYMAKGSNASKVIWDKPETVKGGEPGVSDIAKAAVGSLGRGVAQAARFLNIGSPVTAQSFDYQSSKWAPKVQDSSATTMRIVDDKAKWARDEQQANRRKKLDELSRRNLENRIALNQRSRVATERGQEVMRNLAMLGLLGD